MKSAQKKSDSPERQIVALLQQHIVGAQFTGTVYGTEVTNTQAAIIGELVRRTSKERSPGIEELGQVVGVHPSTVSRVLSHLNALGLIESSRDPADNRRITHKCTHKGDEFITLMWKTVEGLISKRVQHFSKAERLELEQFLTVFAGEKAISSLVRIAQDSTLGLLWRALTYSHGVASGDFVKSGYSASEWVMLSEIHYRKRAPSELATLMKVPRCTISMRLKKLSEAGLVRTEKGNVDKRSRVLSLTEKGLIALAHIEAKAEEVYHRTLKSLSKTELARGITLLTRYVECLYPKPAAQTEVRRLLGNELNAVRERAWVALRHSLPSRYYPAAGFFFHEENINLYLKDQNLAEVALELTAESRKEVRLVNFVTLTDVNFSGSYATLKELVQKVVGKQLTIDAAFAQSICLEGLR